MRKGRPGSEDRRRLRALVLQRDQYRCVNCGSPNDLTLDHIVPISKGGRNTVKNLQTMCGGCNQAKGDRGGWR